MLVPKLLGRVLSLQAPLRVIRLQRLMRLSRYPTLQSSHQSLLSALNSRDLFLI
jgi:hypothetical protein